MSIFLPAYLLHIFVIVSESDKGRLSRVDDAGRGSFQRKTNKKTQLSEEASVFSFICISNAQFVALPLASQMMLALSYLGGCLPPAVFCIPSSYVFLIPLKCMKMKIRNKFLLNIILARKTNIHSHISNYFQLKINEFYNKTAEKVVGIYRT